MGERIQVPADGCPFDRPFPPGFDGCPAYQARPFIGLDILYRPLTPVWTCRHLDSKRAASGEASFYPHCQLGTYEDRVNWAAGIGAERLESVRRLERSTMELQLPYLVELERLKGIQVRPGYLVTEERTSSVAEDMQRVKTELLQATEAHLRTLEAQHVELGITVQMAMELTEGWIDHVIDRPGLVIESWELPPEQLQKIPEELRGLLSPSLPEQERD